MLKVKIIFDIFLPHLMGNVHLALQLSKDDLICSVLCKLFGNVGLLLKCVGQNSSIFYHVLCRMGNVLCNQM
jgi:hypothetical protein